MTSALWSRRPRFSNWSPHSTCVSTTSSPLLLMIPRLSTDTNRALSFDLSCRRAATHSVLIQLMEDTSRRQTEPSGRDQVEPVGSTNMGAPEKFSRARRRLPLPTTLSSCALSGARERKKGVHPLRRLHPVETILYIRSGRKHGRPLATGVSGCLDLRQTLRGNQPQGGGRLEMLICSAVVNDEALSKTSTFFRHTSRSLPFGHLVRSHIQIAKNFPTKRPYARLQRSTGVLVGAR